MADNLGYTPGSGATVATEDVGGVHHQRVLVESAVDGVPTDVSASNPMPIAAYGELIEAMEALRFAVQALTRSGLGQAMPDAAARLRVNIDAGTLPTVTTVGTVTTLTTLTTLTNQTQVGGLSAVEQIPSLMRLGADTLRRNISVT